MAGYVGPLLVLTPAEQARVYDAIRLDMDPAARAIVAKLRAAIDSDPKWRMPCGH